MCNYPPGTPESPNITPTSRRSSWSERYGDRHRIRRVTDFPAGVVPPKRTHIYRRRDYFIIQWYDSKAGKNTAQRVDGDLVDALSVAREIDRRLEDFKDAGRAGRKLGHRELVERFSKDLDRRADAGEIAPTTVGRYGSALSHYLAYAEQQQILKAHPVVVGVDRQFALEFAAFLRNRMISPNGHARARQRKLRGHGFILDAVRAMFEWADDPHRGNCMPAGFRNPFRSAALKRRGQSTDPTIEPDITLDMAVEFLESCDGFQLRLFATMLLCGLRAAEPVFLFHSHITDRWLDVGCLPDLAYVTKGARHKRVPLVAELACLLGMSQATTQGGLLFLRRRVAEGRQKPPLLSCGLAELTAEFERRCAQANAKTAADKQKIRDELVRDAGGLNYDLIDGEFRRVARKLKWPTAATLKDFRHLFATSLANGGMPEHERRYLMGHAPGRDAINIYTHLNAIDEHYQAVVASQWQGILDVLGQRTEAIWRRPHKRPA